MRFKFVTNLSKIIIAQHPERRFPANSCAWYSQQCRAYNLSPRKTLTNHSRISEGIFHFSPCFRIFRRSCSSNLNSNVKMGFLAWYLGLLKSRPVMTKSVSSGLIYAAADITSQMATMESNSNWDAIRTLRMASYGLLILGPAQHLWFNFVARVLPKRDVITTLKKLVMGQLLYGPIVTGIFFAFNAGLQGESGDEIVARLKRDLIPTLVTGLMYWPVCDFLTYKIIPVHLQPLLNSSFAYLWTIYLTYMASLQKAIPT